MNAVEAHDGYELPDVSEAQRCELLRRSEAHCLNPHEAVPLDEALDEIERSL